MHVHNTIKTLQIATVPKTNNNKYLMMAICHSLQLQKEVKSNPSCKKSVWPPRTQPNPSET